MKMSEGKEGATGFIEDYTYDLTPGQELGVSFHMLEVPPAFAATKPEIDVIPLGIGGKGRSGKTDFRRRDRRWYPGNDGRYGRSFPHHLCRYRACKTAETDAKTSGSERIMYRHKPNFQIGTAAWCYAGGAHHSVVSTALTRDDIAMFARRLVPS